MHFARLQYEEEVGGLQEEIEIVVIIVKEVENQEEEEECTFNNFSNMKMEED